MRSAGLITILGQGVKIATQAVGLLVMSRLLTPSQFGIFAILMVFVSLGELMRDFGLSTSAVRARVVTQEQRTTLFWLNVAIGTAFAVLLVATSHPISILFHNDALVVPLCVLSLTFIINGIAAQFLVELVRAARYTSIAASEIASQLIGLGVGVAAALGGAGEWSLILQWILTCTTLLVLRVYWSHWRPGMPRRTDMEDLLTTGRDVWLVQLLTYLSSNADTTVLGIRSTSLIVGFYSRAYQIFTVPINQLYGPIGNVVIPALTRASDSPREFEVLSRRVQIAVGGGMLSLYSSAGMLAPFFVPIVLGDGWRPSVPIFEVLAVGGSVQAFTSITFWIFLSKAQSRQILKISLFTKPATVAAILVGSNWGAVGVAWGYVIGVAIAYPILMRHLISAKIRLPMRYVADGLSLMFCASALWCTFLYLSPSSLLPSLVFSLANLLILGVVAGVLLRSLRSCERSALLHPVERSH